MSTNSASPRLLMLGSCVTRDILNFAHEQRYVLTDYFARSSIASLGSQPIRIDEQRLLRIESDFQRNNVRRDTSKEFLPSMCNRVVDAILIDLIDERFDLFQIRPGTVVTVSKEFLLTQFVAEADLYSERRIPSGSKRHRTLWKESAQRFFETFEKHGLLHKIIVNEVFWSEVLEDGSPLPRYDPAKIDAANEHLAWMYGELEQYLPAKQWMRFPGTLMRANASHRWGLAPFHYSDIYYQEALRQMDEHLVRLSQADKNGFTAAGDTVMSFSITP